MSVLLLSSLSVAELPLAVIATAPISDETLVLYHLHQRSRLKPSLSGFSFQSSFSADIRLTSRFSLSS